MNAVASRAIEESGKQWCPFHASRTPFLVQAGTMDTWLSGAWVLWSPSSLQHSIFIGPLFSWVTHPSLVREPQTVGVLAGTDWMMPNAKFRSRSSFTLFFQWWGTGMGVCTADGFASRVNIMSSGLPVITCNGWWGQVLNALDLKCSRNPSFQTIPIAFSRRERDPGCFIRDCHSSRTSTRCFPAIGGRHVSFWCLTRKTMRDQS